MVGYLESTMKGPMNYWTAKVGLEMMGYTIDEGPLFDQVVTKDDVAYGNVYFINGIFKDHLKVERLPAGYVPHCLKSFAPTFSVHHVDEARRMYGQFLKPVPEKQKAFDGFVNDKDTTAKTMLNLAGYEGLVIVQSVVSYFSEWRIFVAQDELVAAQSYKGSFLTMPDPGVLKAIAANASMKRASAWSFDVGITDDNKTKLIEVHDLYSLGTYGVNCQLFASMLEMAWESEWKRASQ